MFFYRLAIVLERDILIRKKINGKNFETNYFGHDRDEVSEIWDI
jgi:hypothetical protein